MLPTVMTPHDYVMEMLSLKNKINQLKAMIATAVEQITKAIASLHATHCQPMPSAMETKVKNSLSSDSSTEPPSLHSHQLDLPAIIKELKNDIATITNETRAMFHQYLPPPSQAPTPLTPP